MISFKPALAFFLATCLYSGEIVAQTDSLLIKQDQIPSSNSELISRYRSLIMDHVVQGNQNQARHYFQELLRRFDNQFYIPLYPAEKWMLCLITEDYGLLISEIANMDSVQLSQMQNKVKPVQDQLYGILNQKINKSKNDIESNIRKSGLTNEDQDFLLLLLTTLFFLEDGDEQAKVNAGATAYLNDYPASKFENYIRNFIRYEYKPKGFSFGMELFSGAVIMGQNTKNYVQDNGTIGVGFIWGIGKFSINTRICIVFSELKNDIQVNDYVWIKGSDAEVYLPEISLGYKFGITPKFHVSPITGISWYQIWPIEQDKRDNSSLKDVQVNSKPGPIMGVDFGWEFFSRNNYNYSYGKPINVFYSLFARYTFQPVNFSSTYGSMDGFAHNIAVGIKFGFGGSKRVY